jgi:hypothetical protein
MQQVPLECVHDAVATIAADGRLEPGNESMRSLLARLAAAGKVVGRLRDLPLDAEAFAALARGEVVAAVLEGVPCELRQSRDGACLAVRDVTERDAARAAAAHTARARTLARLAGTILHGLNNQLGAALGLVERLSTTASEPADAALLAELREGTRAGAKALTALGRLLAANPRKRQRIDLRTLVDDVVVVVGKMAKGSRTRIQQPPASAGASAGVSVRTVAPEATQALLEGALAALSTQPAVLEFHVGEADRALADGRSRRCVCVRIVARGSENTAAKALLEAASGVAGDRARQGALTAALVVHRLGGALCAGSDADGCWLDYAWPAVASD